MTAVRDFLVAFSIAASALTVLISFVFVGSTLMNDFATLADMGQAAIASVIVAAVLAVPMAAVGATSNHNHWVGNKAA